MNIPDYLSLFPGASREHSRFMAFAGAVLRQATDLIPVIASLQSGFSFACAEGVQLDEIASAVGLDRHDIGTDVPDETFRQYLLAKLALWTWNGTNQEVPGVLGIALPGSIQTDRMDGTAALKPAGTLPAPAVELFPVPAGIGAVI